MVAFRSIDRSIRHRVTSVDVARHAGVSQSTVSLVFSGKGHGRVSEATQDRVRRSARELGYRPNVAAQALRLGTSRAVALLVPDVTNPFFSRVLRGAQRAAAARVHGRAGGHRQRPALAGAVVRGAARRSGGRLPAVRGQPRRTRSATTPPVVLMEAEGPGAPRCASTPRAGGGRVRAPGRARPPPHRPPGGGFDAPTFHLREAARRTVLTRPASTPTSSRAR